MADVALTDSNRDLSFRVIVDQGVGHQKDALSHFPSPRPEVQTCIGLGHPAGIIN
ncbi:MAG: hypothetical protein MZV63_11615 [Marinilabiliales bacterium]|nr:hypothetical protein [Marinilabiliales bacterium]